MATSTISENGKVNNLGSVVNITGYTSDFYEFPCDGYVRADASGSSANAVRIDVYGRVSGTFRIGVNGGNVYPVIATFVRKGMRCKIVSASSGGTATFIPLE